MIRNGSIVLVHLIHPTEKFWGLLHELGVAGVQLRGINVTSFSEWMSQVASREEPSLGLSTMFVPLFRVERIFLDEPVGSVESYQQRFVQRVGMAVERYLALEAGLPASADSSEQPS